MYEILFKESALKELHLLPKTNLIRVTNSIEKLSINPRPAGVIKLKGKQETLWRIRSGDYRVVYKIDDTIRIINIRRIAHRKEVYD